MRRATTDGVNMETTMQAAVTGSSARETRTTPRTEARAANAGTAPAPATALPAKRELSPEESKILTDELNKVMKIIGTKISFSVDKGTKRIVIKVFDSETGEIIRQIPSEEMLQASQRITELVGILFDHAG
jgi:flagellar protein FlaG